MSMALSTTTRLFIAALIFCANNQCVLSDCGWTVEYTNFPNEINYHSTCEDDASLRITMETLQEYTPLESPTPTNMVVFYLQYASDWFWMNPFGEDFAFQGFQCKVNKYIGKLGSLLGGNCLFNLTTYLFEEPATIDIYNLTQFMDKYSFKWDMELAAWPWLSSLNHLELCMDIQSTVGGDELVSASSGDTWVNVSFVDFDVAFPKYFACNGQINGDVKVDVSGDGESASLVTVCVDIPYCDGAIYYDPIVSSNYEYYEASSDSPGLSAWEIVCIVIFVIFCCICVSVWAFNCCKYGPKEGCNRNVTWCTDNVCPDNC